MKRKISKTGVVLAAAFAAQLGAGSAALAADLTKVDVLLPLPEGIPFASLIVARERGYGGWPVGVSGLNVAMQLFERLDQA